VSDPNVDRRIKRDLYARFGVQEYWVVDPDADTVEIHRLGESGYGNPKVLGSGDTLTTPLIPGLEIDLAGFFRP
jgi:Uma2 family endonuclease